MDFLSYQIFILYYNTKHNSTQHIFQENLTKKYRISAACRDFRVEQVSKTRQIATFIPDWNKVNQQLADGLIDEDEYKMWLEDTLKLFNVPIEDFV